MPDAYLDADEIRASTFVRHVEIHETLGSTNDRAAELARVTDIELPALVAARHQTAGRGRGKNEWWSADGALMFSILLDPAAHGIGAANWPQLSLVTAIAVCDALTLELNPQSPRLAIKWPNDVTLGNRKMCGILIESPGGAAPAKHRVIIGIGININNPWPNTCRDAAGSGTSLGDVTGREHELSDILVRLIRGLFARIRELAENDPRLFALIEEFQADPEATS
jgi:BirA family transcriptional regulator, biotin operon repressor / biotin---[acetyl-CoA-carboxylase] ligase